MTKISKTEVEKIAFLSRIKISDKEKEKYSKELSDILIYVEKLNRVDTKNVEPTSQVTRLKNVYREDIVSDATQVDKDKNKNREKLLRNAPSQKDGYIKTRAVLD